MKPVAFYINYAPCGASGGQEMIDSLSNND